MEGYIMDENVILNIRSIGKKMLITAAVFAIVAGIGTLITANITMNSSDSNDGMIAASMFFIVFLDIVRVSGFGMFVTAFLIALVETFGKALKKTYSYVILGGAIFGFIGTFILSYTNIVTTVMNAQMSIYNSGYGSSAEQVLNNAMTSTVVVGCVFMFVSAVAVIGSIIARDYAGAYNDSVYGMASPYNNNAAAGSTWICGQCGTVNDGYSMFCKNCGKTQ